MAHNFSESAKLALKLYKMGNEKDLNLFFEYIVFQGQSMPSLGGKINLMFCDKLDGLLKD